MPPLKLKWVPVIVKSENYWKSINAVTSPEISKALLPIAPGLGSQKSLLPRSGFLGSSWLFVKPCFAFKKSFEFDYDLKCFKYIFNLFR